MGRGAGLGTAAIVASSELTLGVVVVGPRARARRDAALVDQNRALVCAAVSGAVGILVGVGIR